MIGKRIAVLVVLIVMIDSTCRFAFAAINFGDDLDSAIEAGQKDSRPVVVYFTAPWCGMCVKMRGSTFRDAQLDSVADKYHWVKLNIDDHPEAAALLRARGVPYTVVIDPQGIVAAASHGYMSASLFIRFLNGEARSGMSSGIEGHPSLLAEALKPGATVDMIVAALASPQRQGRAMLLSCLKRQGSSMYLPLSVLMVDSRLAVRAAAGEALAHLTGAGLKFDPFANNTVRREQINQWIKWLNEQESDPQVAQPSSTRFTRAKP